MNSDNYPTLNEWFDRVVAIAREQGYFTGHDRHHPEDIYVNIAPIMAAYSEGWADGMRATVKQHG